MASNSQPPVPRDKLLDDKGFLNRTWYRWVLSVGQNSGQLSTPVTIAPNNIFVSGPINAGDTVEVSDLPPNTLLGNAEDTAAPAEPITVVGLSFENGSLAPASIPPLSLSGNPSSVTEPPGTILLDTTALQIINGTLTAIGGDGSGGSGGFALAAALAAWGG